MPRYSRQKKEAKMFPKEERLCSGGQFVETNEWRHKVYTYWRDNLERRLAGVNASLAKLEEQMKREATTRLHNDIRKEDKD
jgi:hypothetical protein